MNWRILLSGNNWDDEGPWGKRTNPQKNNSNGAPADFDDIIRKGQERFRNMGGNWGSPLILLVIIAVVVGLWLIKSIYVVGPDQVGVEMQFGKAKKGLQGPGLHFHFWPIEAVELVPIQAINQENIGFVRSALPDSEQEGLMLSGDQNIIDMQFTVLWQISDPFAYLFNIRDPRELVRLVAESAMRGYVGRVPADEVRTTGREKAQEAVMTTTQSILDYYKVGVMIKGIRLEKADPPAPVSDAFEDVQRAKQDQDRLIEEANTYANKRLGEARGKAAQIAENAKAYAGSVVAQATGEAKRFDAVYEEYRKSPDVTRRRLFYETMENILSKIDKIIIDESINKVVPYLPLNQLKGQPESNKR